MTSHRQHLHVHVHEVDTDRILHAIGELASGLEASLAQGVAQLMATAAEITAQMQGIRNDVGRFGPALANIEADINRIKGKVVGGLTAAEGDAISTELGALGTTLRSIVEAAERIAAATPEEETPPAEPGT